jgi:hypothetical protein
VDDDEDESGTLFGVMSSLDSELTVRGGTVGTNVGIVMGTDGKYRQRATFLGCR